MICSPSMGNGVHFSNILFYFIDGLLVPLSFFSQMLSLLSMMSDLVFMVFLQGASCSLVGAGKYRPSSVCSLFPKAPPASCVALPPQTLSHILAANTRTVRSLLNVSGGTEIPQWCQYPSLYIYKIVNKLINRQKFCIIPFLPQLLFLFHIP